ncbi:MAG: hypothetical protein KIT25_04405 [Enhydrobacter sp.]|nr:MAG: hypothetical protein KIT25_04405 [Enhydrobacter sp.]
MERAFEEIVEPAGGQDRPCPPRSQLHGIVVEAVLSGEEWVVPNATGMFPSARTA